MSAFETWVDHIRDLGNLVNEINPNKAMAQCPAHDDKTPSLLLTRTEDGVLAHCHGGCSKEDVLAAMGWQKAAYFDDPKGATYRYPGGRIVYRTPEKKFWQDGDKKDTSLYRSDLIADTDTVFWVEGEKDVLAVEAAGGHAVTSAGGAKKAHLADPEVLRDKHVRIIADKDGPGFDHALQVRGQLTGIAASVSIFYAAVGKDAADHVAAGKTLDEFVPVMVPDPDPEPLTTRVPLLPFPVDDLPESIANMVTGVAEATQTDPAMAGASALSALAACAGGHAEIQIRAGWQEPLCLFVATVAAPGERKSSVQNSMVSPLLEVEAELQKKAAGAALEAQARKQIATKAAERELNSAAALTGEPAKKATSEAIAAAMFAESMTVPPIPRLVADDVTPEAAASLIVEQGGHLSIISSEGGIFDTLTGRYSKLPNMDLFLKGHAGDPLKVDRKGRPPEYIRRPALTLGLMIQPSVLSAIAANREFRGRGLTARFQFALPTSKVGHRTIAPPPVAPQVQKAYAEVVTELAEGMIGRNGDPAVLTLSETAQAAMVAIETAVEPTLAGDGELAGLADWGAKYVGAVARIAGVLHLAEHGATEGLQKEVTAGTILSASRIGEYFKACAINAFVVMGIDQATGDAIYLLDRIRHLDLAEVNERDLLRSCKSRFKARAEMLPALGRLVEHGYLIGLPAEKTGGRPASPRYRVHSMVTEAPKGPEGPA